LAYSITFSGPASLTFSFFSTISKISLLFEEESLCCSLGMLLGRSSPSESFFSIDILSNESELFVEP